MSPPTRTDPGGPRGPWLGRCDPTVLLGVVVGVPLALVRVLDPGPVAVLWLLTAAAGAGLGGMRPAALLRAQVPFLGFCLSVLVVNAVTRHGDVIAVVGPLVVTDTGLRTGAALGVRTLLVGLLGAVFVHVTDPVDLLGSLHQVGRLPVRAACALLAAYRVLEDLPQEWVTIRRAQTVREPEGRRSRSVSQPGALARAALVLLASSVRRAERVALALESRGLGALDRRRRTVWRPAAVGARDVALVAAVVVVTTAVLYAPVAEYAAMLTAM